MTSRERLVAGCVVEIAFANDDVPTVETVFAPVGEHGAGVERLVSRVPTQRVARATTVNADDLMVGLDHATTVPAIPPAHPSSVNG